MCHGRPVGRLLYSAIASLDGYVADASGGFAWAAPDDEVHAFVNDLQRPIGTYLYGRRMYEVMAAWQSLGDEPGDSRVVADFAALWRAADKVVYSATLLEVGTPRTRLVTRFDSVSVQAMKDGSERDLSVGGPTLAAHALAAGLVDEVQLFVVPEVVGGGTAVFAPGTRASLELVDDHRFAGGTTHLRYRRRPGPVRGRG